MDGGSYFIINYLSSVISGKYCNFIGLVFTTSQSAFRIQTLNFILFIAVKNFKMEEFTNFDILIFKLYIF